ncbi:MAG: imelysin family protein [Bacteroidota bacterium]
MDFYKRIRSALAITSAVVIIMMHACSRKDDVVNPTDAQATSRKAMLTNLADNIIIPSYGKFKARLDAMTSRSNAFTTTPNATTLGEFRTAWIDAYTEWQRVELFDFGPGQVQAIRLISIFIPPVKQALTQISIALM